MALEIGVKYVLERAGGRVVFNDPTDVDYVGRLDSEDGLTGLDGAEVRESADTLVEADGGVHGDFYRGRRPITMKGWIQPDPLEESNRRQDKLLFVTDALTDDAVLRWTETGSVEKMLSLRAQQPTRITGRRPKSFLAALVAADSRIYSSALQSQVVPALGAVSLGGLRWPIEWPLDFTGGAPELGAGIVTNLGNKDSPPRFRIDGPITNPVIANETVDQELRITYTLGSGEWLDIDVVGHTVLLNGTDDRYRLVDFPASDWWTLQPGGNDVKLRASAYSAPAGLTVYWRHAWTG